MGNLCLRKSKKKNHSEHINLEDDPSNQLAYSNHNSIPMPTLQGIPAPQIVSIPQAQHKQSHNHFVIVEEQGDALLNENPIGQEHFVAQQAIEMHQQEPQRQQVPRKLNSSGEKQKQSSASKPQASGNQVSLNIGSKKDYAKLEDDYNGDEKIGADERQEFDQQIQPIEQRDVSYSGQKRGEVALLVNETPTLGADDRWEMKEQQQLFQEEKNENELAKQAEQRQLANQQSQEIHETDTQNIENDESERPLVQKQIQGTALQWRGDGSEVLVTGSWVNWQDKVLLEENAGIKQVIVKLESGEHEFKFIVDGTWMCSNDYEVNERNNNRIFVA